MEGLRSTTRKCAQSSQEMFKNGESIEEVCRDKLLISKADLLRLDEEIPGVF